MMVRIGLICGAIALLLATAPARALEPEQLLGTWKLVQYLRHDTSSGQQSRPLGEHPTGYLVIRPHHVAFVLAPDDNPVHPASGDARHPAATTLAYSGPYTTEFDRQDPNGVLFTLDVDVATDPDLVGTKRTRYAWLAGNRLIIRSQPGPQASVMVFTRAK